MIDPAAPDLRPKRLHELLSEGDELAAARFFAAWRAGMAKGQILWIAAPFAARLHPQGLARVCDPSRILLARPAKPIDAQWCAEEALRSGAFGAVVIEAKATPDLLRSRRLTLAAEAGGALALCLAAHAAGASAAQTRWRCAAMPGGRMRWEAAKNKIGPLTIWEVAHDEAAGSVRMVSVSGGGADGAGAGPCARDPLRRRPAGEERLAALLGERGGGAAGPVCGHGAG